MKKLGDLCGPAPHQATVFVDVDPKVAGGQPLVGGVRPLDLIDRVRAGDDWLAVCEDFNVAPSSMRVLMLLADQLEFDRAALQETEGEG